MDSLLDTLHRFLDWVSSAPPFGLFLALCFLPLFGIPASPFWIALGIRMGTGWGALIAMAALLVNFICGYGLASRLAAGRVRAWLERRGKVIPVLTPGDETRWIILVRVTPGFPLFLQNYLLGMARVSFLRYLLLSLPIQTLYAVLFISLGTSLTGSGLWRGVLALAGLVAAGILVSLVRRNLKMTPDQA